MEFVSLKLTNFKSFKGKHEFHFAEGKPGLHFITGENLVEPDLGANGVGKSSLWDALYWCLYGKSLRGVRASGVRCWQTDEPCSVTLIVAIDSNYYRIFRQWNPNNLTIQKNEEDPLVKVQSEVESLIGLTAWEFENSIIVGQFNTMFFDMSPANKLTVLNDLLNLDYWDDQSAKAKHKSIELIRDYNKIEKEIVSVQSAIDTQKISLERTQTLYNSFELTRQDNVGKLEGMYNRTKKEFDRDRNNLIIIENTVNRLQKELDKLCDSRILGIEVVEKVKAEIQDLRSEKMIYNSNKEDFTKKVLKFDRAHAEGTCPYCEQDVDPKVMLEFKAKYEKQRDELSETLRGIIDTIETKRTNLTIKEDKVASVEIALKSARKQLTSKAVSLADSKVRIHDFERDLSSIQSQIEQQESAENSHAVVLNDLTCCIKELEEKLEELEQECSLLSEDFTCVDFWVKGFKDVRFILVREALDMLEIEVNNNLIELGMEGWTIKLDVERQTKSGELSRGFHVSIKSPHNDEDVPWESWSGGEGQRLRLAGTLGLANLILSRKGIDSNLMVLDEPSRHLHRFGIEDLMDLLYTKARNDNKQIWLVDHHSLDYGNFSSTVTITKDENGSRIQEEEA